MKLLVLDDDKNRLDRFKKALIGHVVRFAETANEAVALLKSEQFDGACRGEAAAKPTVDDEWPCLAAASPSWIEEGQATGRGVAEKRAVFSPGYLTLCAFLISCVTPWESMYSKAKVLKSSHAHALQLERQRPARHHRRSGLFDRLQEPFAFLQGLRRPL